MYRTGGTVDDNTFDGSHVYLGWAGAGQAEERCANSQVKSYEFAGDMHFHSDRAGH